MTSIKNFETNTGITHKTDTKEPVMPKNEIEKNPLTASEFQIIKDHDGFKVMHQNMIFPFATKTPEGAYDFRRRLEILLTVHETCIKIIKLQNECEFYSKKADFTVGGKYHDLFIDSGIIPLFNRTTALTHERIQEIFSTNHPNDIIDTLSEYLNSIIDKKTLAETPTISK